MEKIGAGLVVLLLTSCASTTREGGVASDDTATEYREAYEVYPAASSDGISKHLLRSHSTAILVRPGSSIAELSCRLWDWCWDWGRRLETRFVRFPVLSYGAIPDLPAAPLGMDLDAWEMRLDDLSGRPATTARIEFIIGGEEFYTLLEQAIDDARFSIDLQTYLFDNDDVAAAVADHLRARSEEIDIRVMFDGFGTYLSHLATAESQPEDTEFIDNIPQYLCKGSNIRLRVIPNIWQSLQEHDLRSATGFYRRDEYRS